MIGLESLFGRVITYDPCKLIVIIGDVIVTGFSDGDFITAKRDEDIYIKIKGIDGHVAREKNLNKSGSIEINLLQGSPALKELSSQFNLHRFLNDADNMVAFSIKDPGTGKEILSSANLWVRTIPDFVFGKDVSDRKFVFDCEDLLIAFR